jgi:hypothetical protein
MTDMPVRRGIPGRTGGQAVGQSLGLGPGKADITQKVVIQPTQRAKHAGTLGVVQGGLQGAGGKGAERGKGGPGHHILRPSGLVMLRSCCIRMLEQCRRTMHDENE